MGKLPKLRIYDNMGKKKEGPDMDTENNTFIEKQFDFHIPEEIKTAINNLKEAVLSNSTLLDCYIEEFRAVVHWNTGGEDGITEEQGEELIDYYR